MRYLTAALLAELLFTSHSVAPAKEYSPRETRQIVYRFGQCVAKYHARGAAKMVLRNLDHRAIVRNYIRLLDGDCIARGEALAFPGDFYLFAVADALVARDLSTSPAPNLATAAPLPERVIKPFAKLKAELGYADALEMTAEEETYAKLNAFGECVVRASPAQAKALLMVEPETAVEADRFASLQPALTACAPPDASFEMKKILLRGTIALNYYRLARSVLTTPVR